MLEVIKEKINIKIQDDHNKKQALYDEISNIENELIELNEIILKLNDDNSFLDIPPKEALKILEKIGYTNNAERLDNYLEIIKTLELQRDKNIVESRNIYDF